MSSIIPPIAPTLALNFEQCRNNADAAAMIKRYGLVFGRATTGWSMDRRGILTQAAINEPRVDFSALGVNRGYFAEPLAANLALQTQVFTSASWGKNVGGVNTAVGTSGIEANVALAPDATMTADRVNFLNQADADAGLNQAYTTLVSTAYTNSIFVRGEGADIGRQIRVRLRRTTGASNSTTTTVTLTADWQRVSTTLTTLSDNTGVQVVYSSAVGGAVTALIWQSQFGLGNVATSIIPTTTTSLSRSPDNLTGTGISSLIGQSEFNILAKVDTRSYNNGTARVIADIREDANNYAQLRKTTGGAFEFELVAGGVQQALITDPTGSREGVFKIGARAKANDFKLFVSGASVGTPDVSGSVPTLSKLGVGHAIDGSLNASNWFGDRVGQLYLYNRGLSDAVNQNITRQV
jgi:hypothetical protein